MAAVVMTPQKPVSPLRYVEGDDYVMDTRTPSPIMRGSSGSEDEKAKAANKGSGTENKKENNSYQPDLSSEVAMLSTKLINAINYQTTLDDTLQATRHQLEQAQMELKRVRAEKQSMDDAMEQGMFVRKTEFDTALSRLRTELADERARRETAERLKKQTEGEVETLTSALFEEANTMVAAARKDTKAAEKRNSQLKSQLQDTEFLLSSQQEQLQDLKQTMEKLESSNSEPHDPSIPSTPVMSSATATWDPLHETSTMVDINPEHPLYFSQLLQPVLRTDVGAYTDFAELLSIAKRAAPHSRNASGNISSQSQSTTSAHMSNTSPNLPGSFTFAASGNSSPSSSALAASVPTLKETKYYKRTLLEDIDPTLRLDLAPGLSFLSRRTVLSSLLNGTLAVEPFAPSNYRFYAPIFACALCGESRKQDPYIRKHRFRTSESEDAQRYPLCDYCLGRIRATGDFLGFLRMVKDGYWRCESEENEKAAWEEAVRLRERMFWARVAGGVIPATFKKEVADTHAKDQGASSADRTSSEGAEHTAEVPDKELDTAEGITKEENPQKEAVSGEEHPEKTEAEYSAITKENAEVSTQQTGEETATEATEEGSTSIRQALMNMSATAAAAMVPKTPSPRPEQFPDTEETVRRESEETSQIVESSITTEEAIDETPKASLLEAAPLEQDDEMIVAERPEEATSSSERSEDKSIEQQEIQSKRESASTTPRPTTPHLGDAPQLSTPERRPLPPSPERWPGSSASTPRPSTPQLGGAPQLSTPERQPLPPSPERRPGSSASSTSQTSFRRSRDFNTSPATRRPSSPSKPTSSADGSRPNSVLDRIRAMEARK